MRLIGLMGKSKSGKDTVGQMLVEHNSKGVTLAFADKLKETVIDLFGATHDDVYTEEGKDRKTTFPVYKCPACGSIDCSLEAPTQVVCRKCTAVAAPKSFEQFWTWRMVLQFFGTQAGRRVDQNVWVNAAMRRARHLLGDYAADELRIVERDGKPVTPKLFIAITDCRFKSEMAIIKKMGGEVWRIRRPATDHKGQGLAGHA